MGESVKRSLVGGEEEVWSLTVDVVMKQPTQSGRKSDCVALF